MSLPAFIISEDRVAKKLGLSRTRLRGYRAKLTEGEDWEKRDSEILLSNKGVERLSELCGASITDELLEGPSQKNGGEEKKLTVVALPPNPRMILANRSGDPNEDRELVDVGSNKNFAIGDVMEVAEHETQHGLFQLVSKLPGTNRRPETNGSLRDPGANWALLEEEQNRQRSAEHRRLLAAKKR